MIYKLEYLIFVKVCYGVKYVLEEQKHKSREGKVDVMKNFEEIAATKKLVKQTLNILMFC